MLTRPSALNGYGAIVSVSMMIYPRALRSFGGQALMLTLGLAEVNCPGAARVSMAPGRAGLGNTHIGLELTAHGDALGGVVPET